MVREAVICDGDLPALVALCIASERWHLETKGDPERRPIALMVAPVEGMQAVRRQADLLGCDSDEVARVEGLVRVLLECALAGVSRGASRVVWPTNLGMGSEGELDGIALASDRAVLVSRLVSLDLPGAGIVMETPFVDLTDRQVAELAIDLDAPIEMCPWWLNEDDPTARRWLAALDSVGWRRPAPAGGGRT